MSEEERLDLLERNGVDDAKRTLFKQFSETNKIKYVVLDIKNRSDRPYVTHYIHWLAINRSSAVRRGESINAPRPQKLACLDFAVETHQYEVNISTDVVIAYVRSCLESWGKLVSTDEGFQSILPEAVNDFRNTKFLHKLHKFADGVRRRDYRNIDNFRILMSKEIFCLRKSVPCTEIEFTTSIEKVFSDNMLSDNIELNWKWFVKMLMILTNTACHLINNVPAEVFQELVGQLITAVAKEMRKFWDIENFKWMLATADELETEQLDFYGHQMTSAQVDVLQKLIPCNSDNFKGVLHRPS